MKMCCKALKEVVLALLWFGIFVTCEVHSFKGSVSARTVKLGKGA